jgi:hypothetical protein
MKSELNKERKGHVERNVHSKHKEGRTSNQRKGSKAGNEGKKSKKSKARKGRKVRKKLDLRKLLGILIIVTGIALTVIIFFDSRPLPGPEPQESATITSENNEEGIDTNVEPSNDSENEHDHPVYQTVNYHGLDFIMPAGWHVEDLDDGLSIMIADGAQANILFIETMTSNIELSLEENLAMVSAVFGDTIADLERDAMIISGLPALRHQYVVAVDDVYYDIIGFLFPNGNELIYFQFGTMAGEVVNEETLSIVMHMINSLELPPSEFPPREQ